MKGVCRFGVFYAKMSAEAELCMRKAFYRNLVHLNGLKQMVVRLECQEEGRSGEYEIDVMLGTLGGWPMLGF